jgi:hypothetical protein
MSALQFETILCNLQGTLSSEEEKETKSWSLAAITNKHKDTTIKRRARRGKRLDRNRLSTHFPKIANQWHPTKNGDLTADQVSYGSNKKRWWLCPICGHE